MSAPRRKPYPSHVKSHCEERALDEIHSGLVTLGQELQSFRVSAVMSSQRIKDLELEVAELRAALHNAPANGRCVRCTRRAKHSLCAACVRVTARGVPGERGPR